MNSNRIQAFARKRLLWLLAPLIILPLVTILGLQYRSLRTLERTLPAYRRDLLSNYLEMIIDEAMKVYDENSERILAVPPSLIENVEGGVVKLSPQRPSASMVVSGVADYFRKQDFRAARRYFIALATVSCNGAEGSDILFFNPETQKMQSYAQTDEFRSISIVAASFILYMRNGASVQPGTRGVDRDPSFPMIVRPILNSEGKILGLAGMMLDRDWFRTDVVPKLVMRGFPAPPWSESDDATVVLMDDDYKVLWSSRPVFDAPAEMTRPFAPYLQRHRLSIRTRGLNGEQLARRTFIINLSLSMAMTIVLTGGLLLGLRTAIYERRLSQMKTDFVANVSHEFRTPLTSIRALAEMLKWGRIRDWEKVSEYGEHIDTQGRRLTQLVNNILDFARIESGQKGYHFVSANVREIVDEALDSATIRLKHSGHTVRVETDGHSPFAYFDRDAMALALSNLVDNAFKYSGEGSEVVLRVETNEDRVLISVIDQGIGISRDEHEKIFEKFYRVSTGMVHDVKGSGLGLAIVRHIVEAHEGRITVRSEPDRGSTFTISLPIEKRSSRSEPITAKEEQEPWQEC